MGLNQGENMVVIASEEQKLAYEWAERLDVGVKRCDQEAMMEALQQLHAIDGSKTTQPRKILKLLINAACGADEEFLDIRIKREILSLSRVYMYLEFMERRHDAESLKTEQKKLVDEILDKLKRERDALKRVKNEDVQNGYEFELDMLEAVIKVLLDPDGKRMIKDSMMDLGKTGLLGVGTATLVSAKAIMDYTVGGFSMLAGAGSMGLGIGGEMNIGQIFKSGTQNAMLMKVPLSHTKHVFGIGKKLFAEFGKIKKLNWYIDSMLAYNYSTTARFSAEILDEYLLEHLLEKINADWHANYSCVEALHKVIRFSEELDIQELALMGSEFKPGLKYYTNFGDKNADEKDATMPRKTKKDSDWRIREKAAEACILLCEHPNRNEIGQVAAGYILDRRVREKDKRVQYTLTHPKNVLAMQRTLDKVWESKETRKEKQLATIEQQVAEINEIIKSSWEENKNNYQEELAEQTMLLKKLQESLEKRSGVEISNEEKVEKQKEFEEQRKEIEGMVARIDDFGANMGIVISFTKEIKSQLETIQVKLDQIDEKLDEQQLLLLAMMNKMSSMERKLDLNSSRNQTKLSDAELNQDVETLCRKAMEEEKNHNYGNAMRLYKKSAERGYTRSKTNLGYFLFTTTLPGCQDHELAYYWTKQAANEGHGRAKFNLAQLLEYGMGTAKNLEEALNIYHDLADKGDRDSFKKLNRVNQKIQEEKRKQRFGAGSPRYGVNSPGFSSAGPGYSPR